jgi:hypothetical protein
VTLRNLLAGLANGIRAGNPFAGLTDTVFASGIQVVF